MKAVITVLGKDRPGIIAEVSTSLYHMNANIVDITQTVLSGDIFSMILVAELSAATVSFSELKKEMDSCGKRLGMEIQVQREEIFSSMHRL